MGKKIFNDSYEIMEELRGEKRSFILTNKETLHISKKVTQTIKLDGEHLTFKGNVHVSVGKEYRIEYDKTAFRVEYSCKYFHPESGRKMKPGGDGKIVTYTFTPLKKGQFEIYEVEGFRDHETSRARPQALKDHAGEPPHVHKSLLFRECR